MKVFSQNLATLLPADISLPPQLVETFDWMEDQGWLSVRGNGAPQDHRLSLYPPQVHDDPLIHCVTFGGTVVPFTEHWSTPDPDVDTCIAEIAEISGEGGRIAIWRDGTGKQQFVHINHNSVGVITDDPLVLLQVLASCYPKQGCLRQTDIVPEPNAFQQFLKHQFGLDMPASDIGIIEFPPYPDTATADPFAQWLAASLPAPEPDDLAYELELMRTVDSLDLKDDDSSDTIMTKIGSLFNPKN